MRGCFYIIFSVVIVLILTGVCLLCYTDDKKKSQMSNSNYNQIPYSDNDMRVSCLFENPTKQLSYCPPVAEPTRKRRNRRRRASVPLSTVNTNFPNEYNHRGIQMSSINLER